MEEFQKVAVHAYIKNGDKFLMTLRSPINDYKPNEWDLTGGTVEFGEVTEEALAREILEETNLEVEILRPIYICSEVQNKRHQFWIVYECNYKDGEIRLNPEEHSEYKWVDDKEAGQLNKIHFLDCFYTDYLNK